MSQGIKTSRYGPYALKATCESRYVIYQNKEGKTYEENHAMAAEKLAKIMGWYGTWFGGTVKGVQGMIWLRQSHGDPKFITIALSENVSYG
jgi:hypothetical protein